MWYLIPGLGADERVFRGLRLPGLATVLRWLLPQSPTEPLRHYAARLAEAVPQGQPCWVVGVSFGGLLALEVGRLRPLARIVLISSLANAQQLPPLLRFGRATGLYRLVPFGLLPRLPRLAQWLFGARNGREYRLLACILRDTDPVFARWATRQLLHWDSTGVPPAIRVHGTHDRLLPAGSARIDYPLPSAGHFLIVSHAAQVSQALAQIAEQANKPLYPASTGFLVKNQYISSKFYALIYCQVATNCFRKGLLSGLGLLGMAHLALAQSAPADSVQRPQPPRVLLKAGLRLTHFSYSPGSQAWRVVVPFSLGAEYRLASRFSVYSQVEADLQASRATNRRRQATAVPGTSLALGLRYYYGHQGNPLRNSSLYGSYLALEGNVERTEVTATYVSRSRRQTPTNLTPGVYAFWGTQHRLRRSLLYDLNAGLGVQTPTYYNYETVVPAHYQVAAQVNIRVYWGWGF